MNEKAAELGMSDTQFVEPTGLSPSQRLQPARPGEAGARRARLPADPRVLDPRQGDRQSLQPAAALRNTNGLVRNSRWDIELSKTGYISEAGRCLVMHVRLASKDLIVVLLDSWGKQSRIADANRIRKWLEMSTKASQRT